MSGFCRCLAISGAAWTVFLCRAVQSLHSGIVSIKAEAFDFVDQTSTGDAQDLGRPGPISAGLLQGRNDSVVFLLFQGL